MFEQSNHDANLNETIERSKFFQESQVWPLSEDLNYEGWLKNFNTDEDRKIAKLILDFFIYYPSNMVDQMLKISIGNAGYTLAKHNPNWKHSDFLNSCIYTFIPGETQHPTDSGYRFVHKLREVLEIPEYRIIHFNEIARTLTERGKPTPVIFVDDFVGSGAQCDKAWNYNIFTFNNKTLNEIASEGLHSFIFAPLVMNHQGYDRINKNCKSLILSPTHVLGPEYNLFNEKCFCWKNDQKLFKSGVDLILRKSKELGIPSTNGDSTIDEKGFGAQGLAIKLFQDAPDAVPAFFYWKHKNWTPLFKKNYL